MCISVSEPAKELASATFLKWFTDYVQNVLFAMSTGYLPSEKEAYDSSPFLNIMEEYRTGDSTKKNVAKTYDITLDQILKEQTYSSKPFRGSYQIRVILESTLLDAGDLAKEAAKPLKEQGLSSEDVLSQLNMDQRFKDWINKVKKIRRSKERYSATIVRIRRRKL